MGKQNRLRALCMGVAGHQDAEYFFGFIKQDPLEVNEKLADLPDCSTEEQTFIKCNLIVAASCRMQFSAKRSVKKSAETLPEISR